MPRTTKPQPQDEAIVVEPTGGPVFEPYDSPAGGWGALHATAKVLREQSIAIKGSMSLLSMNQPDGFDCPGCAWPDPKHTSSFEFCENGAKAVSFELTKRRVTRDFFASHSVSQLAEQSDYWLEEQGRLTEPMRYDPATDHYVPVSWDDAFELIGSLRLSHQVDQLRAGEQPDNYLDPAALSSLMRGQLKEAFRAVAAVQRRVSNELSVGAR